MDSIEERVSFVRSVKLAIPPLPRGDTASVVDSIAISFVDNVSGLHKSDVQDSLLFAQLTASAKYDRMKQTKEWYNVFKVTLENVGWITESFSSTSFTAVNSSVDKVVLTTMEALMNPSEFVPLKVMIDALKRPDNIEAYAVLKSHSWEGSRANFVVGGCSSAKDGNVMATNGSFNYEAAGFDGDILFFHLGADPVQFRCGHQIMVLNERIYAQIREVVKEKVGPHIVDFVKDITLLPRTRSTW